jgi:hypothetical protein
MKPTKELHVIMRVPLKDYSLFTEAVTEYVPEAEEISAELINIKQPDPAPVKTRRSTEKRYYINKAELKSLEKLIKQYPDFDSTQILTMSGIPCGTEVVRRVRLKQHSLQNK